MATDDPGDGAAALPHLRLHAVTVFVRDRTRSVRFFVDALGFSLLSGPGEAGAPAWTAVAPPDGTALLSLVEDPAAAAGPAAPIVLLTTDVHGCYDAWTARGVRFRQPPTTGAWGGVHAQLEDPDGHAITLASIDPLTREMDARRRAEAERAERERRSAHELRLAADVQARLLPQAAPPLRTLDCAGQCRQARRVGGDYYDWLPLGEDRLALVLADVSGKGMPAALLMAALQAHVREACLLAASDPARLLAHVNGRFWDTSPSSAYASAIFAEYDDRTRRLRYVNCGHPPALLLRREGTLERLAATATVLGLFETWAGSVAELTIGPGDRLVFYSDGVTEALDAADREFGEERVVRALQDATGSAAAIVERIAGDVLAFGDDDQYDDLTVIAAVGV